MDVNVKDDLDDVIMIRRIDNVILVHGAKHVMLLLKDQETLAWACWCDTLKRMTIDGMATYL
jgi:hypothetical protein